MIPGKKSQPIWAAPKKPVAALNLAQQAEKYIPEDPILIEKWPKMSSEISIITTPPQANVYWRDYTATRSDWEYIGQTPIEGIRIPKGYSRLEIAKDRSIIFSSPRDYSQEKTVSDEIFNIYKSIYIKARKPQAFKPGDEWHPERSGGQSSFWAETPGFSPGSGFIRMIKQNSVQVSNFLMILRLIG